jgi:hypothetical protein
MSATGATGQPLAGNDSFRNVARERDLSVRLVLNRVPPCRCASAPQCSSKSSAVDTSLNHHDAAVQRAGASRLLTLTSSGTREKYMSACWRRASMNGSEQKLKRHSVSWRVDRNQKTRARLQSKVLGERHRQQRAAAASSTQRARAALVGASVANSGQHVAHSKQLLATATRAPRGTHRSRRTAAATQSALARCRASLRVIEFAERQILDVHGSDVLDARK